MTPAPDVRAALKRLVTMLRVEHDHEVGNIVVVNGARYEWYEGITIDTLGELAAALDAAREALGEKG